MSKRGLSMRKSVRPFSAGRMIEGLEDRRLMSVGPASIANGTSNDTVWDANAQTLHTIYYDAQNKTLNYQSFDHDGHASTPVQIDSGDTGQYLSLAEDSNGALHAAYYDGINADLKYAKRDTNGVWSVQTVAWKNKQGLYPSIIVDDDTNLPVISYYNKTAGDLMLAKFDGTNWNTSTIASTGDVGRYSSLAFNENSYSLGVAFENSSNGHFLYAQQAGTGFAITEVDNVTKSGGGYVSLYYNDNGLPSFSYYDAFNADLKYAERSSRGKWTVTTVAHSNSQGLYTDLSHTYNTDQPAIVYYNKTADSVMLAIRSTGNVWNFETEQTGGGRNVSAADGGGGNGQAPDLYLVWYDTATGGLKVGTI